MKNRVFDLHMARELVFERCRRMETEELALEKASGRILAEDVQAQYNIPLFDRSPLDGYAFRAADTAAASRNQGVTLAVTEEIAAGGCSDREVKAGCAVKILTGAPIPPGADAVARYEDTEFGDDFVTVYAPYRAGQNIVRMGEDVCMGELIARKGTRIDAAVHGMLASQGIAQVKVYKIPLIGVISQGNELLEPGEEMRAGRIYNSNRYMIGTALKEAGFCSHYLGSVGDDEREIMHLLQTAVSMYDVVIMTGGVSVGTYDYSESALEKAGAEILVDQVKMKPGSSCCLAVLEDVPVFALSGNPAAAMTTFHLIALPAIRRIAGYAEFFPKKITVELNEDFAKKSPGMRILKGCLDLSDGMVRMRLNEHQTNGSVSAMRDAEVFAVVPAGSGPLRKGSILDAFQIR